MFVALVLTGLSAGLFVGWAVSVIPGTRRTSDRTYVETMQRINVAIVNPPFLVIFMGTAIALLISAILLFAGDQTRRAWWATAATATYVVGMLGVTIGGNIPLNNALDSFDLGDAGDDEVNRQRRDYEGPWNRLHYTRSAAGLVALGMIAVTALIDTE